MPAARGGSPTERAIRPYWSQVLRSLREARGITQEGWAAALGVGRTTVQRWESGASPPDAFGEKALTDYCIERGLFRRFERGPLKDTTLSPGALSDLLAEARLEPVVGGRLPAAPTPNIGRVGGTDLGTFVGRRRELEWIRTAFDDAVLGRGSAVTLSGEPGIGKTRTVQELERYALERGAHVLWGRAYEADGAPAYWPWVQIGNAWASAVELLGGGAATLERIAPHIGQLARLFPALRTTAGFEPGETPDPQAAQFELFDAFSRFMIAESAVRPWFVVIDDLHWADKPTLQLLAFLARDLPKMRVLLIGTYRDHELTRSHPLADALVELDHDAKLLRIALTGLDREEVTEYLRETTQREPAPEAVRRILERTEGNPFFMGQILRLLAGDDSASAVAATTALPAGIRQALGRRLSRLPASTSEVLAYAAVAGRQFSLETLEAVCPGTDCERSMENAVAAGIIEEADRAGSYRFTHALMQQTLLDELSLAQRARLHGEIAEAIERRYEHRAEGQSTRLARHFSESAAVNPAHIPRAIRYLDLAGELAANASGWSEAVRLYSQCRALMSEASPGDVQASGVDTGRLHLALGRAAKYDSQHGRAWRALLTAMETFAARGEVIRAAGAAVETLDIYIAPAPRVEIADRALDMLDGADPQLEAMLIIQRLRLRSLQPERERALEARLAELRAAHRSPAVEANVAGFAVDRALSQGRPQEAAELAVVATELYLEAGDLEQAAAVMYGRAVAIGHLGRFDAALHALAELREFAGRAQMRLFEGLAHQGLAGLHFYRCEYAEYRASVASIPETNFVGPLFAVQELEQAGRLDRAVELLPTRDAAAGVAGWQVIVNGLRARVLYNAGLIEEARVDLRIWYDAVLRIEGSVPNGLGPLESGLAQIDEALPALGDDEMARVVGDLLDERPLTRTGGEGRGLDALRGGLALRFGNLEAATSHFERGQAWAQLEHSPVTAGRCLQGLASVAESLGDYPTALRHLEAAAPMFTDRGANLYLEHVLERQRVLSSR